MALINNATPNPYIVGITNLPLGVYSVVDSDSLVWVYRLPYWRNGIVLGAMIINSRGTPDTPAFSSWNDARFFRIADTADIVVPGKAG